MPSKKRSSVDEKVGEVELEDAEIEDASEDVKSRDTDEISKEAKNGDDEEDENSGDNDEDAPAEEEDDASEEKEAPVPRKTKHSGTSKKSSTDTPKSRNALYAVIATITLLVPIAAAAYFFYGPSGEVKKMDVMLGPTGNGFSAMILVDTGKPARISGDIGVTIIHDGTSVYTGTMLLADSRATRDFTFPDFATGNGDYKVQFSYKGFSTTKTINFETLVEKLEVTTYNITNALNSSLVVPGEAKLGITVLFTNLNNTAQRTVTGDKLELELFREGAALSKETGTLTGSAQFRGTYTIPGGGNYSAKVKFTNSRMKPGSDLTAISAVSRDVYTNYTMTFVNIPPTANAGPDQTITYKLLDGGAWVTLDGYNSKDYDGSITSYFWDYGEIATASEKSGEGVKVTHKYTQRGSYTAQLTVVDNGGEMSTDECVVTVV